MYRNPTLDKERGSLMADKKNLKQYDYLHIELFDILHRRQFSDVLHFLEDHGGLNAVDEHGRTALIALILRPCSLLPNEKFLLNFENEFAKKLVALGCALGYQSAHNMYKREADEKRVLQCTRYLMNMGISLYQPDFQGKIPITYLRNVGLHGLADELSEGTI